MFADRPHTGNLRLPDCLGSATEVTVGNICTIRALLRSLHCVRKGHTP